MLGKSKRSLMDFHCAARNVHVPSMTDPVVPTWNDDNPSKACWKELHPIPEIGANAFVPEISVGDDRMFFRSRYFVGPFAIADILESFRGFQLVL